MRASPFLKYRKSFTTAVKAAFEYRINFFLSLAGAVSPVVIQTALWIVLYQGGGEGDALFGFTFPQMIAWTVIAQLVSRLVRTGFEYEVNTDIKTGSLDRYLVRPVSYFGFRLFSFLGDKLAQTLFSCVLLAAAVAVLGAATGFAVSGSSIALFSLALVLAFVLNFLLFWCVGLAGFWLTEIGFLFEAVRIVIIAASGGIFPLSVFGPEGERLLSLLPFRYTIQFPADLLAGRIPETLILRQFALAVFWIAVLTIAARFVWKCGIRRFAAVGS